MRKLLTVSFLALAATAAAAQAGPSKYVVWSADTACGRKNLLTSPDNAPSCQSIETPRGKVSVINYDELSLAVGFLEDGDYIVVATQIRNRSNMPFELDTDKWGAAHFERQEDFFNREKPLLAETSFPSREIVRGIKSGATIDNATETFMAGLSKTGVVKDVRRQDGTRVKQVMIGDDNEAINTAGVRNSARLDKASSDQERIRKSAFTQKWLGPLGDAKGLVYFRRVKKARLVVFSFRILEVTYVFRMLRDVEK